MLVSPAEIRIIHRIATQAKSLSASLFPSIACPPKDLKDGTQPPPSYLSLVMHDLGLGGLRRRCTQCRTPVDCRGRHIHLSVYSSRQPASPPLSLFFILSSSPPAPDSAPHFVDWRSSRHNARPPPLLLHCPWPILPPIHNQSIDRPIPPAPHHQHRFLPEENHQPTSRRPKINSSMQKRAQTSCSTSERIYTDSSSQQTFSGL